MGPSYHEEMSTNVAKRGNRRMQQENKQQRQEFASSKHGSRLPNWVIIWFYVTAVICTWDASFIMFRPFSLPGGSLAWIWHFYKYYITLDQRYQDIGDAYVFAQSLMNYGEVVFNIITIGMHYMNSRHTVMTGFMVSVMTFWKTVLYFLMLSEFCTGGEYRQGNSLLAEFFLVFIPNFVWIVVPLYVMYVLWCQLIQEAANATQYHQTQTLDKTTNPAPLPLTPQERSAIQDSLKGLETRFTYNLEQYFRAAEDSFVNSTDVASLHKRKGQR